MACVPKGREGLDVGRLAHTAVDFRGAGAIHLQAEGHIVIDRHMGIKRVGLEHHGHAAIRRVAVGHLGATNRNTAARHTFETGDHPQQCRFSTAGRAHKYSEFTGLDLEVDAMDDLGVSKGFMDVFQAQFGH